MQRRNGLKAPSRSDQIDFPKRRMSFVTRKYPGLLLFYSFTRQVFIGCLHTVRGAADTAVNRADRNPHLHGALGVETVQRGVGTR